MITVINHHDRDVAHQIYHLQQASYAVERDLIEYPNFPPLRVTVADIQQEDEMFLGYWQAEGLCGVLSFTRTSTHIDIVRLIVDPSSFRQGIASALLNAVEAYAVAGMQLTVSTAAKNVPAVRLYHKHRYQIVRRTVLPDGLELVHFSKEGKPA